MKLERKGADTDRARRTVPPAPPLPPCPPLRVLTNIDPPSIQAFHGDKEALPLVPNSVGHRDSTVFKDDGSGWLRVPPNLAKIRECMAVQAFTVRGSVGRKPG